MRKTIEPQYQRLLELREQNGLTSLGLMTNQVWHDDPRRLLFFLARYKFVAKMLSGKKNVLEVGCGDAFGTKIVSQEVEQVCAVDFDPIFIKDACERLHDIKQIQCKVHDMLSDPVEGMFDAAYSLDVIEHIPKNQEDIFISNMTGSLGPNGILIVGTPTIQSQCYASSVSKSGHVNCMDHSELRRLMNKYYYNVFLFSMNDEVVHTGFYPMAHYLIALCVGIKAF